MRNDPSYDKAQANFEETMKTSMSIWAAEYIVFKQWDTAAAIEASQQIAKDEDQELEPVQDGSNNPQVQAVARRLLEDDLIPDWGDF